MPSIAVKDRDKCATYSLLVVADCEIYVLCHICSTKIEQNILYLSSLHIPMYALNAEPNMSELLII